MVCATPPPHRFDVGMHPRVMAALIGHGTAKTTMEVYARASNSADHEAAGLLQQRFAEAFGEGVQVDPGVTQTRPTERANRVRQEHERSFTVTPKPSVTCAFEWG